MPDAQIHGIEYEIRGNANSAVSSLDKLASTLSKLKSLTSGGLGLNHVNNGVKSLSQNKVTQIIDSVKISRDLRSVDAEIAKTQKAISKMRDLISGGKLNESEVGSLASQIRDYENVLSGLYNQRQGIVDGSRYSPPKNATGDWKEVTKAARGFSDRLKNIASSFKRILGYRLIRTAIKLIGDAFREGTQNMYQWSKAFGGPANSSAMTFAQNMDDVATSLAYVKNSVGAAVAPLANLLAPALRTVTDAAVELLNIINQLVALLTGQSGWTRAIRNATEYGDAVGGAGGKAKEALKYLAPFDELNVLPDEKSGGGGGSALSSISEAFEEMDFSEWAKDLIPTIEDIKDRFESIRDSLLGIWESPLVKSIREAALQGAINTLKTTLESVDLALQGIDSLVNGDILDGIGKLAEAFETVLSPVEDLSDYISNISSAPWRGLAKYIFGEDNVPEWVNTAIELFGFINKLSVLNELDLTGPVMSVGALKNAFDSLESSWESSGWRSLLQKETWENALGAMFEGFVEKLPDSLQTIVKSVDEALGEFSFDGIFNSIENSATSWWPNAKNFIDNKIIGHIKQAFIDALNVVISVGESAVQEIIDAINKIPGFNIPDVHFNLIPDLDPPPDEKYEQTKREIEEASKNDPTRLSGDWRENLRDKLQDGLNQYNLQANVTPTLKTNQDTVQDMLNKQNKDLELPFTARLNNWYRDPSVWHGENWDTIAYTARLNNWKKDTSVWHGDNWNSIDYTANLTWWKRDPSVWTSDWNYIDYTANLDNWRKDPSVWKGDRWNNIDFKANLNNWQKDPDKWHGDNWNNINFKANLNDWQKDPDKWKGASWNNIDFNANIVKVISPSKTQQISVNAKIDKVITPDGKFTLTKAATGGVFSNGHWSPIQQFASGGSAGLGQIFIARERGPELVGSLGGHTAVMNNDQIVASVSAGVARAISAIRFQMSGFEMAFSVPDTQGMDEDALYRAFRRALDETDFGPDEITLDGEPVYRNMVRRNRQNTRMTGVNAFA